MSDGKSIRAWERFYGRGFAATRSRAMELITILNRCHRFRGFVYQHAHFSADKKSIEVAVRPRKGSAAVCSRCHLPAPGYDQLAERRMSSCLCRTSRRTVPASRHPTPCQGVRQLHPKL